jgi:hypothetical protein
MAKTGASSLDERSGTRINEASDASIPLHSIEATRYGR